MLRRLGVALSLLPVAGLAQTATLDAELALDAPLPLFGGLSALEISDDGGTAYALSDRGTGFVLTLTRSDGRLTGATAAPWTDPVIVGDSEGLAIGPDIAAYSTEGPAGVRQLSGSALPDHPDFDGLSPNAALEALAVAPDGAIWAMPEETQTDRFSTYRFDGAWSLGPSLQADGGFRPTGADFGPDGLLYVLERQFTAFGFRSRVRRMDTATGAAETVLETGLSPAGNFEGIAVWRDPEGATRLTLVADNNFLAFIENRLTEYVVQDRQ